MRIRATILSLLLCACDMDTGGWGKQSSHSAVAPSTTTNAGTLASLACSPLDGRYTFRYSEIGSGACGMWSDDTLDFMNGRLEASSTHGCAEGQVTMTDNCVLRIESTCTAAVDRGQPDLVTQYVTGSITEPQDNRYATGTVQVTFVYASGRRCVGEYRVLANRTN